MGNRDIVQLYVSNGSALSCVCNMELGAIGHLVAKTHRSSAQQRLPHLAYLWNGEFLAKCSQSAVYSLIHSCITSRRSPSQQSTDQKSVVKRLLQAASGKWQPGIALIQHLTETSNALSLLQYVCSKEWSCSQQPFFVMCPKQPYTCYALTSSQNCSFCCIMAPTMHESCTCATLQSYAAVKHTVVLSRGW